MHKRNTDPVPLIPHGPAPSSGRPAPTAAFKRRALHIHCTASPSRLTPFVRKFKPPPRESHGALRSSAPTPTLPVKHK